MIYFIQQGEHPLGPIKAGISSDPLRRIAQLQTGSPQRLYLLGVIGQPGGPQTINDEQYERELHGMWRAYRLHGEWFKATAPVLNVIHAQSLPLMRECRVCGGRPEMRSGTYPGPSRPEVFAFVVCQKCQSEGFAAETYRGAAELWNGGGLQVERRGAEYVSQRPIPRRRVVFSGETVLHTGPHIRAEAVTGRWEVAEDVGCEFVLRANGQPVVLEDSAVAAVLREEA